jgi:hypothetical protein
MSERLHVITACSRPENLTRVGESIAAAACDPWEVCWHVRFDLARDHVGGQALKNRMLDQITDGWVTVIDDDTLMHPDLLAVASAYRAKDMLVVSQRRADGRFLAAKPENMRVGQVDIGQVVVRREFIGGARIPENYEGDGEFIAFLTAAANAAYLWNEVSFHNALHPVAA